eukprot:TRINITY_DN37323_c0_g1_i2.p1 TRINITY_DN37323_c0_g1~~TRINITY_DN37323_c0_g1_i2.p1  ORF type:complete len:252 (-),score=41.19 TRINITY_DN37323_c0_g1_i2:11-766(-)
MAGRDKSQEFDEWAKYLELTQSLVQKSRQHEQENKELQAQNKSLQERLTTLEEEVRHVKRVRLSSPVAAHKNGCSCECHPTASPASVTPASPKVKLEQPPPMQRDNSLFGGSPSQAEVFKILFDDGYKQQNSKSDGKKEVIELDATQPLTSKQLSPTKTPLVVPQNHVERLSPPIIDVTKASNWGYGDSQMDGEEASDGSVLFGSHAIGEDVRKEEDQPSKNPPKAEIDVQQIGRAVQQECRDRSRMPSSA